MRLAKYVKKPCFLPILTQKTVFFSEFPVYRVESPVYPKVKNLRKTLMRYQGFSEFFYPKLGFFPYMGPPGPPKQLKTAVFGRPPPPKIIKNRLNFAHSEICEKLRFLAKTVFLPPPSKINYLLE